MSNDDKILENDIQYMLRGCDPHDAEARRHIARCIIAYVREHDGRDAWQSIETAPRDTVVLLYTPHLHGSNPERIEVRVYHDSRAGTRHAWATQWKPIDSLIDAAIAKAGK